MQITVSYKPSFEIVKVRVLDKYQRQCVCKTYGQEDGDTTCWVHHDCSDGTCTHTDGDDY